MNSSLQYRAACAKCCENVRNHNDRSEKGKGSLSIGTVRESRAGLRIMFYSSL